MRKLSGSEDKYEGRIPRCFWPWKVSFPMFYTALRALVRADIAADKRYSGRYNMGLS